MTKKVRIENADTSSFQVVVEVWDKGVNGALDTLQDTRTLAFPTALVEVGIHSTRYLIVKEVAA